MKRDSINDRKLLSKTSYFIETRRDYSFQELQEIKACYDNLYISKYTDLNPRFTIKYLDLIQKNPYFSVNVLRNAQEIKAVFAYYCINETITTPIFWYKNENLYRHISYLLLDQSLLHKKTLNQSSWAWQFKLNRWAKKYMEYSLVYYKHISFGKRVVWNILYFFSRKFWESLLKNNIY